LRVAGSLYVEGTSDNRAVLTSFNDDTVGGDSDGDVGGNTPHFQAMAILDGGRAELSNASVRHASTALIVEDGGYASSVSSRFNHHQTAGLAVQHGGQASVQNSEFSGGSTGVIVNEGADAKIEGARFSDLTTGVEMGDGDTTVSHSSFDQIRQDTIKVKATSFDPKNIAVGNTATNSATNGVHLIDPVFADGATLFGRPGWGLVISNYNWSGTTANVPAGATVTAPAGTVLKFRLISTGGGAYTLGPGSLQVAGTLEVNGTAANPVVMTKVNDDTAGGDTDNGDLADPLWYFGSHFSGIDALSGSRVDLAGVDVRYATTALRVARGAHAEIHGRVADSSVGVSSDGVYVDATKVDWGSPSGPRPHGTGVAVQGSGVDVVPWIGYEPLPRPTPAAPQSVPDDNKCADVTILGLRGSGEAPLATWSGLGIWIPPTFGGDQDGFGGNAWQIREGFVKRLQNLRPGIQTKSVAIRYMGLPVPILGLNAEVLITPGFTPYVDSIYDGVDKLLQRMRDECDDTKFVLTGYSQGALSIHLALRQLAVNDPAMLDRVAGVGLVADPGRVVNGAETLWGGAGTGASWMVRGAAGVQASLLLADASLSGPLPNAVTDRTVSICHDLDMVCAIYPFANPVPHSNYSSAETNAMGAWLAEKMVG
jgi:hypothetical protein